MKEKKVISLNSKVLNEASIEELEERLELSCWTQCGGTPSYEDMYCANPYELGYE
jgi:hypothetical protein